MGLFKFLMTIGKGSIGETVKVLANEYNMLVPNTIVLAKRKEAFEAVFNNRKLLNRQFQQQGDMLLRTEFEDFYQSFGYCCNENLKAQNDLALFIYFILFHEGRAFRKGLEAQSEKSRNDVFETIYEVTAKYSPVGITLSKADFVTYSGNMFYTLSPGFM